jgi:acetyltransferase-like isoleucine patch superfamily enzyme
MFKRKNKIMSSLSPVEEIKENISKNVKLGLKIGENYEIHENVNFGSEPYLITIGDNVRITSDVEFVTHDGGVWVLRNMHLLDDADIFGPINIDDNVHIGKKSIIMPGVTIGNNCIIGCGSIVTKDIPADSVAVGVPAKVIETITQYYEKHKDTCDFTKHMYPEGKKDYLYKKYNLKD